MQQAFPGLMPMGFQSFGDPETLSFLDRAHPSDAARGALSESARANAVRGPKVVLVVEDEELLRAMVTEILQQAGFHVLSAMDGSDALRVAELFEAPIDLVLSDVVMPHLGGRELAEALGATRPDTRVLLMSGYTSDRVLLQGISRREWHFIAKPFRIHSLLGKVREVLDVEPAGG